MYRQAAVHPLDLNGQRSAPLLFWAAGLIYKINVSRLFFDVFALVVPLLNSLAGIVYAGGVGVAFNVWPGFGFTALANSSKLIIIKGF